MSIFDIIELVAVTSSTKEKQMILENQKDNNNLRLCFFYAESPRIQFWIRSTELPIPGGTEDISATTFFALQKIADRIVTGNAAREFLREILKPLTVDAQTIVNRIVNKDLRCNAGTAIANKVWKNLIPEYPCLLCGKFDEKAQKYLSQFENKVGFIVQKKEDGGRLIVKVDLEGKVTYHSRNGNTLDLFGVFDKQFSRHPGSVFDGELIVKTADGKPDRKAGNGFYTKAVRGTLTKAEAEKFSVQLWDIVPDIEYNTVGTIPYQERLETLINLGWGKNINIVQSLKVATIAECMEFYGQMRADGQEGAIIKVANAVWEDSRSKNYVKLKAINDIDALCVGVEEGTGKNAGKIGALVCTDSTGMLKFSVGTGLKDVDRDRPPSYYIGQIIECVYNEVITARGRDTKSLFLPVYKQVRFDKSVANSLEELK